MILTSYPTGINFSGTLPKFIGTGPSNEVLTVSLMLAGTLLFTEKYYPDSTGKFELDFSEILTGQLELAIPAPGTAVFNQTGAYKALTVQIDSTIDISENHFLTIIKGGINYSPTISTFLAARFLTWQPQIKTVKTTDQEWLTYCTQETSVVKVKGYFDGVAPEIATLTTLTSGRVNTFNVIFSAIDALFAGTPISYDVWVETEGGTKLTYTQRYLVTTEVFEYDNLFVFENTIGGIDTIRFYGECIEDNELTLKRAVFDKIRKEYFSSNLQIFKKNTGIFRSENEWKWAIEFFKSTNRHAYFGQALTQIFVQDVKLSTKQFELNSGEFEYAVAEDNQFNSVARVELPDPAYPLPYQPTIYFGFTVTRPTTAAAILALPQMQLASDPTGTLNTGAYKKFHISIPANMVLVEVYNATAEEDVTSEYTKDLQMIIVAGASHKCYTMEMAANYLTGQEHNFTIAYE